MKTRGFASMLPQLLLNSGKLYIAKLPTKLRYNESIQQQLLDDLEMPVNICGTNISELLEFEWLTEDEDGLLDAVPLVDAELIVVGYAPQNWGCGSTHNALFVVGEHA